MSNEVTLFDQGQSGLPAHLNNMFDENESNIDQGSSINALSIKGKVFRVIYEGDEQPIMRTNEDGDKEPVTSLRVIVINQGPFGARVYYGKSYDQSTGGEAPKCFSLDGKYPDPKAAEPQASTCATCPHAVKGSKISQSGAQTTACQMQRRLAVVPEKKPEFAPLLLRLAPTSAYDPETKGAENGWMAWRQFLDFINSRGVRHTAQLVTTMKFDSNAEHPKLLFKPSRFLSEEEAKVIAPRINEEDVLELIKAPDNAGPQPVEEAKASEPEEPEEEETAPPAEPEKPAAKKASAFDDDDEEEQEEEKPEPKPAKKKKTTKKKAAKKPASSEDDDDDGELERKTAAGSPEAAPPPDKTANLEKLLDDWDA